MKNSKGFSLVYILLAVLVIGLISTTGFIVYKNNKSTNKSISTVSDNTIQNSPPINSSYDLNTLNSSIDGADVDGNLNSSQIENDLNSML